MSGDLLDSEKGNSFRYLNHVGTDKTPYVHSRSFVIFIAGFTLVGSNANANIGKPGAGPVWTRSQIGGKSGHLFSMFCCLRSAILIESYAVKYLILRVKTPKILQKYYIYMYLCNLYLYPSICVIYIYDL